MSYRLVVLKAGHRESRRASFLTFYSQNRGFETVHATLTSLANALFSMYCRKKSGGKEETEQHFLGATDQPSCDFEEFSRWIVKLHSVVLCDLGVDLETWWPWYSWETLVGTPPEDTIEVHSNAEVLLPLLLNLDRLDLQHLKEQHQEFVGSYGMGDGPEAARTLLATSVWTRA